MPTILLGNFEASNDKYQLQVRVGNRGFRIAEQHGEYERGGYTLSLVITTLPNGDKAQKFDVSIELANLPNNKAVLHFLEQLDLVTLVPETSAFEEMNSAKELAEFFTQQPQPELARDTRIPCVTYRTPMRPAQFFEEHRAQMLATLRDQLKDT